MPQWSEELEGTVVFFDDGRGWGYIRRDDGAGAKDVFVHYSQIRGIRGRRQLFPGWRVSFELGDIGRGPMAFNVWVTDTMTTSRTKEASA